MRDSVPVWNSPPGDLKLARGEVHAWRASVDLAESQIAAMAETLSVDEQNRAGKFYFERDRCSFIVTRGILRTLLGRYLDQSPSRLRFCYGPQGKPALTQDSGADTLRFNLSHSHGMALFALARDREVGVDLERIRPGLASEEIAERFFSPREVFMLRKVPLEMRVEAFFNCWTRKEAYVKATGKGLSLPLDEFVVSLAPGEPAALLETITDYREASRWCLRSLAPRPGYVGALAVTGDCPALKCWHWFADPWLEPPKSNVRRYWASCRGGGSGFGGA
jgi:4'-phosphopantetheinyl transferase